MFMNPTVVMMLPSLLLLSLVFDSDRSLLCFYLSNHFQTLHSITELLVMLSVIDSTNICSVIESTKMHDAPVAFMNSLHVK